MKAFALAIAAGLVATAIWAAATGLLDKDRDSALVSPPTPASTPAPTLGAPDESRRRSYTTAIEGTLYVAHVNSDPDWKEDLQADTGDELYLYAWYYNREDVTSGLYASNLTVQFIPSQTRAQQQWLGVRIFGDNTNVVKDWVRVHVPPGNVVVPVKGTATWRHNRAKDDEEARWVTQKIRGDLFGRGVILEDAGPCLLCEATVRVVLRVEPA